MAKSIHVRDAELLRALEEGADYLVAGQRRFLLVEVQESTGAEFHDVTVPEEVRILDEALQDTSQPLEGEEARKYLQERLNHYGVR